MQNRKCNREYAIFHAISIAGGFGTVSAENCIFHAWSEVFDVQETVQAYQLERFLRIAAVRFGQITFRSIKILELLFKRGLGIGKDSGS